MKIRMKFRNETKTCYRFERRDEETGNLITLYLKKADIRESGINPMKGIDLTIEEAN